MRPISPSADKPIWIPRVQRISGNMSVKDPMRSRTLSFRMYHPNQSFARGGAGPGNLTSGFHANLPVHSYRLTCVGHIQV